jgi:crossover junction endodeoxyribonuclease RuvC
MRILGIDPGSRIMGWGIIHVDQGLEKIGLCGQIRPKGSSISKKLGQIYTELSEIMAKNTPDCMVLESIFVNMNPQSALTLGYARGVAMAVASHHHIEIIEYAPNTIKKSLTGYGHATKEQMIAMIARLFNTPSLPADTADALAVGLCHARHMAFLNSLR